MKMKKITDFLPNLSFKKLLHNKKVIIPLSIFLSFLMWAVIVLNENPVRERTFSNMSVNINLENTLVSENGMNIVDDISSQKFTVVVRGPSYVVSSLRGEDLNIFASAAEVAAPGEYNLSVSVMNNSINSGYEVLSITPATVKVNFDYVDTKEFVVKALAEGASAETGLIAETGVVSGLEGNTFKITGPRTIINKIENVVAYAKVNKVLKFSETFDAKILLYDKDGKEIDKKGLTINDTNVKVTVPISKKKTVPVKVAYTNLPEGFNVKNLSAEIDHSTVTIIGTPETIEKTNQITLSAIDIGSISKTSNEFDVSAKLPEGVRIFDNIEYFKVKVDTKNFAEKTVTITEFKVKGLDSSLKAGNAASIKNVKLCGLKSEINKISASNVYAEIDLTNKTVGSHTVTVVIKFKDYNNVWSVGEYSTTITLKE